MNERMEIEPELLDLLKDIAGDEGATLLRVPPAKRRALLFERDPRAFPSQAFQSNAEKRILEKYRAEVGRILHAYSIVLVETQPPARFCLYGDRVRRRPSSTEIQDRAKAALRVGSEIGLDPETRRVLDQCTNHGTSASLSGLGAARLRMTPSESARVSFLLSTLADAGPTDHVRNQLAECAETAASAAVASHALEGIAWADWTRGRFSSACTSYRAAAERDDSRVAPLMFWLSSALCSERSEDARLAAQLLDERIDVNAPALRWYAAKLAEERGRQPEQFSQVPFPVNRRQVLDLLQSAGPASGSILDALVWHWLGPAPKAAAQGISVPVPGREHRIGAVVRP